MSRGKRARVIEGIYRDAYGLSATVKVGNVQREQRFALDTDLDHIKSWRIATRADLDAERQDTLKHVIGTLEHDGAKFLQRKKGLVSFKADRAHFRAWLPSFGKRLRSAITRADVEAELARWRDAGVAARTIRHRLRLLRECYQYFGGPKARTPVDGVKRPKIPAAHPVSVPARTIKRVATNLKQAGLMKDYARFLVRATTGQRPAQIMRTQPDDLDLKRRLWYVRPAKDGDSIPFPLTPDMVKAWRLFAKVDAWGDFDTAEAADTLREHGWPKDIRPYTLRHTFAIDLILSGADLGDLQGLLGHKQIQTTRQHYAHMLIARLRKTVRKRRLSL